MPKNFKSIPPKISTAINGAQNNALEVRALLRVSEDTCEAYEHYELNAGRLEVGHTWTLSPPSICGRTSKKNLEGWEITRRDLPKYTKTFCHDIQVFGDAARNGWATVCSDREVYHRDVYTAPMHQVIVTIEEELEGAAFGVSFRVLDHFDRNSDTFEEDILFAINLLQEVTGVAEVVEPNAPRSFHSEVLNWELFPPGDIEGVIASLRTAGRVSAGGEDTARERLALFERFEPQHYLKGLGGTDTYVGAKYSDDLVVFENIKYGNALYVLYEDWEIQSQMPRSKLLRLSGEKLDRIVHNEGWEDIFKELLRAQMRKRGVRLRAR